MQFNRLNNIRLSSPAGTDIYFKSPSSTEEFKRLRIDSDSGTAELTFKKKLKNSNSWTRIEVDLPLRVNKGGGNALIELIKEYNSLTGYMFEFKIFKKSFNVKSEKFIYSYYIVDGQDAFIEVEARKDVFKSKEEAFLELEKEEKFCLSGLGLSKSDRTNDSLYEIYRGKK